MQPDADDFPRIAVDGFQSPARGVQHGLALGGDMSRKQEYQAAKRIDLILLGCQLRIHDFGEFLEFDSGIGLPQPVFEHRQLTGGLLVMFVLDLADDLLDQVLDVQKHIGSN